MDHDRQTTDFSHGSLCDPRDKPCSGGDRYRKLEFVGDCDDVLKESDSSAEYLGGVFTFVESAFIVLPITGAIAERSIQFTAGYPKDPADRVIGATACVHGIRLVTKDKPIRRSKQVDCVW